MSATDQHLDRTHRSTEAAAPPSDVCRCGHDVTDHGLNEVGCINCSCATFQGRHRD